MIGPHFSSLSALHTLDMSTTGSSVALKDVAALASALAALPVLRDLSLSGVRLEDAGWAAIAEALGTHPLTSLSLARCCLKSRFLLFHESGDGGAAAATLSAVVRPCDSSSPGGHSGTTQDEYAGSPHIAASMRDTLRALDLSGNDLQDMCVAWETLCWRQLQSLPALQTLSIGNQGSKHDAQGLLGAAGPGANFRLRALAANSLRHGALTHTLSGALRLHTGLTSLNVHDTNIHPGVASALGGLASLRELRLGKCTELLAAGGDWRGVVYALGGLTALQLLALEGCALDAVRVVAITHHLSALKRLKVRRRARG